MRLAPVLPHITIHGLAYDVVMKLCQHIAGKKHHLYCDNYFTSILLFTDLLDMKIYASGTIRQNKQGLPGEVKKTTSYEPWRSPIFPKGKLGCCSQDNKPIQILSTNSRPDATVVINRRHGADTIHVDQPENVFPVQ